MYLMKQLLICQFISNLGFKVEIFDVKKNRCLFRGKVIKNSLSFDKGTSSIICYDYIWYLLKNKVYYKFNGFSAYDCVKKIFDDLEIPYSDEGIFGGKNGEGADITIDHIVSGVSAYKCIMMIATELHVQLGTYYYVYMDEAGNVNVTQCDKYWSRQIITTANRHNYAITDKVTGNLISGNYDNSMENVITRVLVYDENGEEVDLGGEE